MVPRPPCDFVMDKHSKVKLQCEIVLLVNCGLWLSAESVGLKKNTVKQGQPI